MMFFLPGSEGHFRVVLGPDRARALCEVLAMACAEASALASSAGFEEPRTEPVVAFDLTVSGILAREEFKDVPHLNINQQHLWVLGGYYALRIKKLKAGYRSGNHSSLQQNMISQQLKLPDLPSELIYVVAGVVYDKADLPTGEIVVVKYYKGAMYSQRVEWVADLHEIAQGIMLPRTPTLFDFQSIEQIVQPKISVKAKQVTQDSNLSIADQEG